MASKTKPSEFDFVWQSWKVAVQFGVDNPASPTAVKDMGKHEGIVPLRDFSIVTVSDHPSQP